MTRIRIKGTGIKGKASPETEPDFYSMPLVKPEESLRAFSQDLEVQVAAAIEEENKRSEPTKQLSRKRQDEGNKRSRAAPRKRVKAEPVESKSGCESPRITSMDLAAPALITPDSGSKQKLIIPSSFDSSLIPTTFHRRSGPHSRRPTEQQTIVDLTPPLLALEDMDAKAEELHSGDDVTFEGKHFHYLDSFVAPPTISSHLFSLEPRRNGTTVPLNYQHDIASPIFPHLTNDLSESSLSLAQSLREPILTPSSSSSSLSEMFQQDDSLEMNPDTIFAERGFGNDDWAIGGAVDIDAELGLLGR